MRRFAALKEPVAASRLLRHRQDFRSPLVLQSSHCDTGTNTITAPHCATMAAAPSLRRSGGNAVGQNHIGALFAEVNQLLTRLAALLLDTRPSESGKLVALHWILAPIDSSPVRRVPRASKRVAVRSGKAQARPR